MREKKKVFKWIKDHRSQLIAAGVCITAIIAIIVGLKRKDDIMIEWEKLKGLFKNGNASDNKPEVDVVKVAPPISPISIDQPVVPVSPVVNATNRDPFGVSKHIRNLAQGQHASAEKIATAAENGFVLQPGQTWVEEYVKGVEAA